MTHDQNDNETGTTIYGFFVWLLVSLFVLYSFSLNTASGIFARTIRETLHITTTEASYAMGVFAISFALMQIPAGYLVDRFRSRMVVSAGLFVLVAGTVLTAFSKDVYLFVISNFLQGIGAAFAFVAAGALIAQWFPLKAFPIFFGLTQTLSCLLAAVIHVLFTRLMHTHTWNQVYLYVGFGGVALLVLTVLFVKNPSHYRPDKDKALVKSVLQVCRNSQIWLCAFGAATSCGILLAYASFWSMKVQEFHKVSQVDAVAISGMILVGLGVGTPFMGWVSNLFKSRKMVLHMSLTIGVMAILASLYLPHFNMKTLIIANTTAFMVGFFLSGSMLYFTVASELVPMDLKGVALGVTNMLTFLSSAVLLSLPYIFKTSIQYYTSLWILPFLIMVSISLLYFVKETYQ